jgi:hypothetical protein
MPSPSRPSDRVLHNRQVRIEVHRAALDALTLGMAQGLFHLGNAIIEEATAAAPRDPEAATERGVPMMADTGTVQVWALGKRAFGTWAKKPKGGKVPPDQAVLFVGFDSRLSHLVELGTVKMAARPFLMPALASAIANAGPYIKAGMSRYAASAPTRTAKGIEIKARIAAARAAKDGAG